MSPHDPQSTKHQAMDRLIQQDRVLSTEALMLPLDRPLTDEQHDQVRRAVREFITDANGTQIVPYTQIGQEVQLSGSVISEYMKGKYRGNNDRVSKALNLWLDRHLKRSRSKGPRGYVPTWCVEEMAAFIRLADRRQKMAAIVSPSGSGKDMVIEAIKDELGAVVVYADATTTATRLIQAIASAIGLQVVSDTHALKERIIGRLKNRSTLLFINEAQQLARRGKGERCASVLRSIYDQTGVPVILFGSAEIFAFIDDRDPASGGGQLYRRCLKLNLLNRARQVEDPDNPGRVGRCLFSKEEVRAFLRMKQVKLSGDVFRLMHAIANLTEHGTLGLCCDVLENIADLWPGETITAEHVFSALSICLDADADPARAQIEAAEVANEEPAAHAAAG